MIAADIVFLKLFDGATQFTVPRWQRKYQWRGDQIGRLVDDLVAIGSLPEGANHYAGNILTFPDPEPAGQHPVSRVRVVDGQQRLVTVSIILAAAAEAMGDDGAWGAWNRETILDSYIRNKAAGDRSLKLRLQDTDADAYAQALDGGTGAGCVGDAWRLVRKLMRVVGYEAVLKGLFRLKVLSVTLHESEDPQQVFESLNGTGRILTEGEKVKNWVFMGLPETRQEELHAGPWTNMLKRVGAPDEDKVPLDRFLRAYLQRQTGSPAGVDSIYQRMRRYALARAPAIDRTGVLSEIDQFSRYAGAAAGRLDLGLGPAVASELRHLRRMGLTAIDSLVLRILQDGDPEGRPERNTPAETAAALSAVSTWATRMWLSGRSMAGMNRTAIRFASEGGPDTPPTTAEAIRAGLAALSGTGQGVPDDTAVAWGLRNRKAYGGTSSECARAVLLALTERRQVGEAPDGEGITLEHVMPQTLTDAWRRDLGAGWKAVHDRWANLLPNLTLVGWPIQPKLGNESFAEKRRVFAESGIHLTKDLAGFETWAEDDLDERASRLLKLITDAWPWESTDGPGTTGDHLEWTLKGRTRRSDSARALMGDVVAALEDLRPGTVAAYAARDAAARAGRNLRIAESRDVLVKSWSRSLKAGEYLTHPDGWCLYVNFSNSDKAPILRAAAEAAGIPWGAPDTGLLIRLK